jgi:precorrin-3B methylase
MNTISLFVALSQVDFMMIRMSADLMVNYYTYHRFMRNKTVNHELYEQYMRTHCVDAVHYATDTERPDTLSKTDSSIYDITYRRP